MNIRCPNLHRDVMVRSALCRHASTRSMCVIRFDCTAQHNNFFICVFCIDVNTTARATGSFIICNVSMIHENITIFYKNTSPIDPGRIICNASLLIQGGISSRYINCVKEPFNPLA